MPKRAAKKKSPPRIKARPGAGLEKSLAKQKKEDLVKLLMEIALPHQRRSIRAIPTVTMGLERKHLFLSPKFRQLKQ